MLAQVRHILLLLILVMGVPSLAIPQSTHATFTLEKSPLLKKKLHERFLRLVRGGDGHYYVFKTASGHYWHFAGEGERALQIIRFSPDLSPVDTIRIRRINPPALLRNAYEVLPAPNGIAILTVARSQHTGMPALMLSEPAFNTSPPSFQTRILDDLPAFSLGIDDPGLRYTFSPDSSLILLAWRRVCRDEPTDNSLACMILDRNLQVIQEPFLPFRTFEEPILLREMYLLDAEHILFTAETYSGGNAFQGPATLSFGLLHYTVGEGHMRVIHFSKTNQVPVEMRIVTNEPGRLTVSGWYLDQENERRQAGVFIGRITSADTLEELQRFPFTETLRDALIQREKKSGAVAIRGSYHSEVLATTNGYTFVLHLRGAPDKGIEIHSPGTKTNNALHAWMFDRDLQLTSYTTTGFLSLGREEMMETFSWRPLRVGEKWYALATDYSHVKNESKPVGAATYAWDLQEYTFNLLMQEAKQAFTTIAPREMVQIGEGEWLGIAVAGRQWRLVRLRI